MAREPGQRGIIGSLRKILRPLRRWYEYQRRALPTHAFRIAVPVGRALRILPPSAGAQQPMRLLIVNLTPHLGDAVLQMPLIERLRAAHPQARIEYAVEASAAPLLARMKELDHVYALRLGSVPPLPYPLAVRRARDVIRAYWHQLRGVAPTICLLPRWGDDLFRSSVLAYLTGAPRRIGYAADVAAGAPPAPYRDSLLTEPVRGGSGEHEPLRLCRLACEAGLIPRSALEDVSTRSSASLQHIAAESWPALAQRVGLDGARPYAVIAPGASMPRRMWPVEKWAVVMRELEAMGLHTVILSGPADKDVAERLHFMTCAGATLLAGSTSLVESVALIGHACLFLGSDSGPGHIAGALGIPSVILFVAAEGVDPNHASAPERVRPFGPHVFCCRPQHSIAPCEFTCVAEDAHCIATITPEDVLCSARAAMASVGNEVVRV